MTSLNDRFDDGFRSSELAIRAGREKRVRSGELEPRNEQERRWAAEGPVASPADLECARDG